MGIIWKKAPPINEPAAKATSGNRMRCKVDGFNSSVMLPTIAMELIRRLLPIIQ